MFGHFVAVFFEAANNISIPDLQLGASGLVLWVLKDQSKRIERLEKRAMQRRVSDGPMCPLPGCPVQHKGKGEHGQDNAHQ